ncbi:acetylxylan esterase precursor [Fusarium fujikuroi]|nr:acetylxylan esterase precursor [Fusarium fujikuroi]
MIAFMLIVSLFLALAAANATANAITCAKGAHLVVARVSRPRTASSSRSANPVSMLSLAGLADELARTYVNELKHSDRDRQENLAHEMIWILKRIIQCRLPEHALRPERIPHLTRETFWLPFTLSYPESVPLFAKAGWSIPNEGWY